MDEILSGSKKNAVVMNMEEFTGKVSSYDQDSFRRPFNPDDLYRKYYNYDIYDSMRTDDQVSICLQMKKDLVLGTGFSFKSKEQGQEDLVSFLTSSFEEDVAYPFDEQLEEVLTAYEYGHSSSEKIFQERTDGFRVFKELKTRHPNTWLYETDDKGNILTYKQRGMVAGADIIIDSNSVFHYINKRRFQNPYGESDLRPAYQAWFTKKEVTKYFAIFLEKGASPIPVGKYNPSASTETKASLLNILKKFQSKTALVVPKDMELQFLESSNNGEAYRAAINIFNMFIGRCLFIPDLLGFQGGETSGGSYSLGKDQMKMFFLHISRRRKQLEQMINKQLIKPLCIYNFNCKENHPKFAFNPISEEAVYESVKTWIEVAKVNAFKPNDEEINYIRKILNFPEGEVIKSAPVVLPQNMPQEEEAEKKDDDGEEVEEKEGDYHNKKLQKPIENEEEISLDKEEKKYAKSAISEYGKKVDFKKIENSLDTFKDALMDELAPVLKKMFIDLGDQIDKKKIVKDNKIERIEDIKLKGLKDVKQALKNAFKEMYQDSKRMAQSELFKVNFALPLPTDEFMDFLEKETYSFVGDWSYNITKDAKIKIIQAIKDGTPISSVINSLSEDGLASSEVSIERYARTKFTEVMNRGRLELFESSKIVQGYEYSAILDNVTSDICESLDGKVFKAGEQPIPPLHFNCRSLLIPITIYEEVKKWNMVPQGITDKINTGGFSVQ